MPSAPTMPPTVGPRELGLAAPHGWGGVLCSDSSVSNNLPFAYFSLSFSFQSHRICETRAGEEALSLVQLSAIAQTWQMPHNPSRYKLKALSVDAQHAVDEYKARSVWSAW